MPHKGNRDTRLRELDWDASGTLAYPTIDAAASVGCDVGAQWPAHFVDRTHRAESTGEFEAHLSDVVMFRAAPTHEAERSERH
jgi:hypothetical protein